MGKEWKTTIVYTAVAWIFFLSSEIIGGFWGIAAFFVYFILLLSGAIALIVRLIRCICRRKSVLAPLAMVLAVLPFCFMLEIREGVARVEDFLWRDARMEIIESLEGGSSGSLDLPEGMQRLSDGADYFVWYEDDALQAVAFYNMRGILGPAFSTVYCPDGNPPVEKWLSTYEIYECKPLGDGWYYVWYA